MATSNEKIPDPSAASGQVQDDNCQDVAAEVVFIATHLDVEGEKKLLRKIDLHLMPLMFILYLFQYLDKTSLGYTTIMGILEETHLVGTEYSWVASFFYVGFLVASPIAAVALVKLPVAKVVCVTVLIWAGVLMCMGAAHNFGGLSALRILLGIFEAAINPGFTLITSMWYKPSEHALRHGLWYSGASIATIFGGLLAYGISHITSSLSPWQWLFIIFGACTFVWGIVMFIFLPDSPQTARFLTPEERHQVFVRVQGLQHSAHTRKWNPAQLKEALIDPKSWLLFLLSIFLTLPGGGLSNFGALIVAGFGYTTFQVQLLTMVQGAFLLIFVVMTVTMSMYLRNGRCYSIALLNLISLVGCLMVKLLPTDMKWSRLGSLWLIGAYASSFPTILSLVSSNVIGYTKKSSVNGMIFLGFCAGYIIGPQSFLTNEAPSYPTAFNIMIACFVLNIVIILVMRQLMEWSNKKRDRSADGIILSGEESAQTELAQMELDETDWQNKTIRYAL